MRQALLVSVAAVALAAGSTLALSQGNQHPQGGSGGTMQQNPSGGASGGASGSMQKDQDSGPQKKGAQDHTQPSQKSTQDRQDRPGASGTQQQQQKSTQERQDRPGASDTQKSTQDRQQQPGTQQRQQTQSPTQQRQTESPQQPGSKQGQSAQQPGGTSGTSQGTAQNQRNMQSSNVSLTTEQKTTIRNTVINSGPRVSSVDFNVSVGTVVPRSVRLAPVPTTLVEINPAWRGHRFFVYEEEIIIVEADTLRIVAVVPV